MRTRAVHPANQPEIATRRARAPIGCRATGNARHKPTLAMIARCAAAIDRRLDIRRVPRGAVHGASQAWAWQDLFCAAEAGPTPSQREAECLRATRYSCVLVCAFWRTRLT